MSSITRKVFTALATSALAASAASAQAVNYTTTGYFTSLAATCNQAAPGLLVVACTNGTGFSLTFTGDAGVNIGSPSTSQLGTFLLTGPASGTVTALPGDVMFTLVINQTTPSGGSGNFVGSITGSVTTDPFAGNTSSLVWRPQQFVNIGPVNYEFIFDNTLPAGGTGRNISINNSTTLEARIVNTAVPEPATVVLMGSGLAALGFFGARRKKN